MIWLFLLAILLYIIVIVVICMGGIKYQPSEDAKRQYLIDLLQQKVCGIHKLRDDLDYLLFAEDRDFLSQYVGNPYVQPTKYAITTANDDSTDYARDLYYCNLLNGTLSEVSEQWTFAETNADLLWKLIFDIEANKTIRVDTLTATNEPGCLALPYYIIKRDYPGISLPLDILPKGKNWYFPVNTIDDVYALQKLNYRFDSILNKASIRWYHFVSTNLTMPTVTTRPINSMFSQYPSVFSRIGNNYTIYTNAWMSFIQGKLKVLRNKNSILEFAEGGYVEPTNTQSVFLNGAVSFTIPTPIAETTLYINGQLQSKDVILMPRQFIVVFIKLVPLQCYRKISIYNYNTTSSSCNVIHNGSSITISTDKDGRLVVDSSLENKVRPHTETRRISWTSSTSASETVVINNNTIQISDCGYVDANIKSSNSV